jgi:hypothetical protein
MLILNVQVAFRPGLKIQFAPWPLPAVSCSKAPQLPGTVPGSGVHAPVSSKVAPAAEHDGPVVAVNRASVAIGCAAAAVARPVGVTGALPRPKGHASAP